MRAIVKSLALPAFFVVCFVLSSSVTSGAANLVSGSYESSGGTDIVLTLAIKTPSPSNLIVEQFISPGNNITATSPPAIKINAPKGEVKWLFRNIRSGNLTLRNRINQTMVAAWRPSASPNPALKPAGS